MEELGGRLERVENMSASLENYVLEEFEWAKINTIKLTIGSSDWRKL